VSGTFGPAAGTGTGADLSAWARACVSGGSRSVLGTGLDAKVDLIIDGDQARERPVLAHAELVVNGHMVRAHATAGTMRAAVDLLTTCLRERLERRAPFQEDSTTP
jgi:hypothetical protein